MSERGDRDRGRTADLQARLPLLDRLIDEAPETLREPQPSWPEELDELGLSPVGWGIADFSAGAFNDRRRRDQLRAEIEATIRRFDPRLANVRVSLPDTNVQIEPTLRLRIEALLLVEPAPEPIAFDTMIDAATAEVVVKAGDASERAPGDV
jgi:type VI secretion system protein ImpF